MLIIGFEQILNHRSFRYCSVTYNVTKGMVHYKKSKNMMAISIKGWGVRSIPSCFYFFLYGFKMMQKCIKNFFSPGGGTNQVSKNGLMSKKN